LTLLAQISQRGRVTAVLASWQQPISIAFWAPGTRFPRLTIGGVQVSSKTGLWPAPDYV
jgi:hypothetical protein